MTVVELLYMKYNKVKNVRNVLFVLCIFDNPTSISYSVNPLHTHFIL
jgi:hypothetical protein